MQDFSEAQFKCIHIPLTLEVPQGFWDYPENTPSTSFVHTSAWWESLPHLCRCISWALGYFHFFGPGSCLWECHYLKKKKTNDDT